MVHSCPRECYTARRRRPPTLTSKHPPGCTRLRLAREPRRVAWYTGSAERADSFRRSMPGVEELGAAEAGADTRARAYLPWLFKAGLTPDQARPRAARARRRPCAPPKRCPVPAPARATSLPGGPATGPRACGVARVHCSRAASLQGLSQAASAAAALSARGERRAGGMTRTAHAGPDQHGELVRRAARGGAAGDGRRPGALPGRCRALRQRALLGHAVVLAHGARAEPGPLRSRAALRPGGQCLGRTGLVAGRRQSCAGAGV